jgi:hypothetical protein
MMARSRTDLSPRGGGDRKAKHHDPPGAGETRSIAVDGIQPSTNHVTASATSADTGEQDRTSNTTFCATVGLPEVCRVLRIATHTGRDMLVRGRFPIAPLPHRRCTPYRFRLVDLLHFCRAWPLEEPDPQRRGEIPPAV